ncbi:MAG TPA: hypothetical protein VFX70_08745 [Mycobacteriales bacterium]|nr:hypothetical protein [Mycobacteriales bacterium]
MDRHVDRHQVLPPIVTAALPTALPVLPALRPLLPGNGLRRGGVVSVSGGPGATSLLLALLAGTSAVGGWCAVVNLPTLGPAAAAELGVDLERLVVVPSPGRRWAGVVAGLLDGFDVVAVRPPGRVGPGDARRLLGRARERGATLLTVGDWSGAGLRLSVSAPRWQGVGGEGRGRLRARCLTVRTQGRGAAAQPRLARLWLPAPGGGCTAAPAAPAAPFTESGGRAATTAAGTGS